MDLTPDTDPARLSRLSLPSRGAAENREELERLANICTPRHVDIHVTFTESEASCQPAASDAGADGPALQSNTGASAPTDAYEIRLPTEKVEQGRTRMHPRRWDRRVQVGLLFHELGHVLHSDLERFGEWQDALAPEWRQLFRTAYNAAEDGIVETQMAAEFDVGDDFVVLHDAFARRERRQHRQFVELFDTAESQRGEPTGPTAAPGGARSPPPEEAVAGSRRRRGGRATERREAAVTLPPPDAPCDGPPLEYTVKEALGIGLLDRGFGDSGRFDAIVDPEVDRLVVRNGRRDVLKRLQPTMEEYMRRMFAQPDGSRRVDLAAAFLRTVRPVLADLPPAQLLDGQRPRAWPRDARPVAVTAPLPADRLPGADAGADGADVAVATPAADERGRQGVDRPGVLDEGTVRDAERRLRTETDQQLDGDTTSAVEREARALLRMVSEHEGLDRVGVPELDSGAGDRERWAAAREDATRVEAALETQLRRERRASPTGGHRAGTLDSRRLVDVHRGSTRVFRRVEPGDEKDYSCLLVLDRSGSMEDEQLIAAEDATARLALAMHGVGVDTSVLSVYRGYPWLELPFGGDPRDHVDRLLTARNGGGTPLSAALTIARERVESGAGHEPLVFVLTDGRPDDERRYQQVLDTCNFPVFGIYVLDEGEAPDHAEFFDRLLVSDTDGIRQTVMNLARTLLRRR